MAPPLTFLPSTGHIKPKRSKSIFVTFKTSKPHVLKGQRVVGKVWKISFPRPISHVPDWDDRMKSVQWVTVPPPPAPSTTTGGLENASTNSIPASSSTASKPHAPPLKKKVIETEKEPQHQLVDDAQREVELMVSGVADFCKYECSVTEVRFRDTLVFQARVYKFPLKNTGRIELRYEWVVLNQSSSSASSRPVSHIEDREHAGNAALSEDREPLPFSVSPSSGCIQPDEEVEITVRFSPMTVLQSHCLLHCQ